MGKSPDDRRVAITVVDDDESFLRAISRLLRLEGYDVRVFSSPEEFLAQAAADDSACLILDLQMPALSGLDVQRLVRDRKETLPVIFLSGKAQVPDSVQAMRQGAVDFLLKPVAAEDLTRTVSQAVQRHRALVKEQSRKDAIMRRFQTLTPREREVGILVARGLLNKNIAWELGIAEKTVKIHRARVMSKMEANSVPDLVRSLEVIEPPGGISPNSNTALGASAEQPG